MIELTVVVKQQHKQLCPTAPFEPSFRLAKQFPGVDQGPGIIKEVHILWRSTESGSLRPHACTTLTTISPGLNTRFAWYPQSSTLSFALCTPGSVLLPRSLMTSKTCGMVSRSSWFGGEASMIPFRSNSYRSSLGIGRLMNALRSNFLESGWRMHC
jgi:hypothetical protein